MNELRLLLRDRLGETGFSEAFGTDSLSDRVIYSRRSQHDDLYDHIVVYWNSPRSHVYATAGCAIVPGYTAVKGMAEDEYVSVTNLAGDDGWSSACTTESRANWAEAVVRSAPLVLSRVVDKFGVRLLHQTQQARSACARYIDQLASAFQSPDALERLTSHLGVEGIAESERIAILGRSVFPAIENAYRKAALLLVRYSEEIEQNGWSYRRFDGTTDREGMWRLQILASRLASEQW